jgi:hypothetical protein
MMATDSQVLMQSAPTSGEGRLPYRLAVAVLIGIPLLCILGKQAGLLRFAFPALSVACCAFLLWKSKPLYMGAVLWLWFLTPFLRRMADYQGGWSERSAVLLAPYAAAGIAAFPLLMSFYRLSSRAYLPFICALAGIAYGFAIGIVHFGLYFVFQALLNWIVPIIFGMFVYENRYLYPEFKRVMEKTFLYGVLLTAAYGLYQYFVLPDWDRTWLLNVQMNPFGTIEPMGVRVFSTMNAPTVFGAVMAMGLLLLSNLRGWIRLIAMGLGLLGLILTMSRSSWIALIAGAIFLAIWMELKQLRRMAVAVFACVVAMMILMQIPAINDLVTQRLETFSDPRHDVSFGARVAGHEEAFRTLSGEPFGEGVGSPEALHPTEGDDEIIGPHDSTPLELLYSLGWFGTGIYVVGVAILVLRVFRVESKDVFVLSSKAIMVGFLAESLVNSVLLGVLGFMVWTFATLVIAESEYTQACAMNPGVANQQPPGYLAA